MNEVPSNNWPINRAALKWLREAKESPQQDASYVAQLAMWGLEKGIVDVSRPLSPSQPERHELELVVGTVFGWEPEEASEWFLSNPNLEREEQEDNLAWLLEQAKSPQEAAQIAVETAYDLMVAKS
jgi:hypothetical protein